MFNFAESLCNITYVHPKHKFSSFWGGSFHSLVLGKFQFFSTTFTLERSSEFVLFAHQPSAWCLQGDGKSQRQRFYLFLRHANGCACRDRHQPGSVLFLSLGLSCLKPQGDAEILADFFSAFKLGAPVWRRIRNCLFAMHGVLLKRL